MYVNTLQARLADGEVEMPKEECRWIEERNQDPMAEGGRVFGVGVLAIAIGGRRLNVRRLPGWRYASRHMGCSVYCVVSAECQWRMNVWRLETCAKPSARVSGVKGCSV